MKLLHDRPRMLLIAGLVLMSVTLDFVQEYRANTAAERLRDSVALRATVLRDGVRIEIPASDVVPGDVVLLAAGLNLFNPSIVNPSATSIL